MSKIQEFLSQIFLFQSLSIEHLKIIESSASLKKLAKGEYLFHEGQVATAFYILVSGLVKIYKLSADGNEQILHIQKPGDLIAEAVIFDFDEFPAFGQALEETEVLRFSKPDFLVTLQRFPEISFAIMRAYSQRIRQLVEKIEEISLHDVKSRLANFLINNCQKVGDHYFCSLDISKKDLAATLGTIPETLSRVLNQFKKMELIKEEKNKILILKLRLLKSFC